MYMLVSRSSLIPLFLSCNTDYIMIFLFFVGEALLEWNLRRQIRMDGGEDGGNCALKRCDG
jgi:hypothetical protein